MPDVDPLSLIRRLLPVRDLPREERPEVPRRGSGRPRTIRRAPAPDDTYMDRLNLLRGQASECDAVLSACRLAGGGRDVLDAAIVGMASEAAALAFERQAVERRGGDVGSICSRRVSALAQLASLIVERTRAVGEPDLDPRDPRLQRIIADFDGILAATAEEVMGREMADVFVAAYKSRVAGWESRLRPAGVPEEVPTPGSA